MAQVSYREAVALAIGREMAADERVIFLGEDVAAAGGVFKATSGLLERFGSARVLDTPISEQAILGAAMGAAMTGLVPIAEVMFADFFAVCWDIVANEIAKARYMTNGQVCLPLVIRSGNGGGVRFGAQHSQSVEAWAMAIPGLKVVAPSCARDVLGLFHEAVMDPDPVLFFEHKALYAQREEIDEEEIETASIPLGTAATRREGKDVTIVALGAMVQQAMRAAAALEGEQIAAEVLDLRCLVPLDVSAVAASLKKTGRLVTVEENPRLCGWGAELSSIVAEECLFDLDGPIVRVTTPHIPLPAADRLEDAALPSPERIVEGVHRALA